MKRGALKARARDISVVLVVLVCATVGIWTWDSTPTAFLPPQRHFLKLDTEEKVERISTAQNTETKDSYSSATPFVNKEQSKEDHTDNKDTEEEKEKQVEEVSVSETNQGKTPPVEEKNLEQVEQEVIVSEPKHQKTPPTTSEESKLKKVKQEVSVGEAEAKTTHIEKTTQDQEKKTLATDEAKKDIKACNYAKGKWVVDKHRPLYSGSRCKQWLASMWACRLMKRKDFAFERLRWQPKDCSMEGFEGSKFLRRMQDKTLAFVGDSLGRQQFQSMMCMITGGKKRLHVLNVGREFGFRTPRGRARPGGWAYRFTQTNTTVLYHWSSTLCDIEPINISNPLTEHAMHLDRPPAFLRNYLHKINVLVMNTGHHWNRGKLNGNRWVMHVNGAPNANRKLAALGDAKNFTIHSTVSWVSSQLLNHPGLKAFYRSLSPRHFVGGEWNTGGSCDNTTPMSIGKEVLQEESSDYSAGHAVKGTGVKLLDVTALSRVRDEGHISRFSISAKRGVQDCLHWCLPGVPDTWNEILFAMI
ncbi:Protein trichome birefringence-like 16 [Raphanus sativus]|uniref:Protein trichome birefringence-like 16 n=1 Tax=Raphanus sativus TaxID=3726 RepID=A0A6J0MR29_RAPSA|nr:protein trichome birefringence-like 16 [Raphanus sativus]XP_056853878.1 protein trichome birefringence-like 16 [Raphanus sativus]XP_056853879.1 protein trichome birefringence-like 16 [Raphanus sativus]XP_056861176.1 protein trichome birefringence-like 16 [Raphanus sativus]XP_056861177.1 protein trichome birefringence-like 16 [Raphanus sativus]XP_056861178.1 protein trichome birefringence-like 16 [Raphanus sativus]KAJ4870848.1 Protein trichome birefringence-like 16 [Raphanus sativus]KAJ490